MDRGYQNKQIRELLSQNARLRAQLAEAQEVIECYKAMKEGFEIRAGDYETKLAGAEAKMERMREVVEGYHFELSENTRAAMRKALK